MISHLDKSGRTRGFNSGYLGKGSRLNLLGARREGGRDRGQGAGKDEAWKGAKGRSREVRETGRLGDRGARIRLNSSTALLRHPYRWTPRQPKCNLPRRPQSRSTCPRPRPRMLRPLRTLYSRFRLKPDVTTHHPSRKEERRLTRRPGIVCPCAPTFFLGFKPSLPQNIGLGWGDAPAPGPPMAGALAFAACPLAGVPVRAPHLQAPSSPTSPNRRAEMTTVPKRAEAGFISAPFFLPRTRLAGVQ